MACKPINEQKEIINNERARLESLAQEGLDITEALSTLNEIEKNLGNPVRIKNLVRKHSKQFKQLSDKDIAELNKRSLRLSGETVKVLSGYTDKSGNRKFNISTPSGNQTVHGSELDENVQRIREHKIDRTDTINDLWNDPDKALDLFDQLASIEEDSEHTKEQRELLESIMEHTTPVMNEFKTFVTKGASKNQGIVQIVKDETVLKLDISTDRAHLGDMSASEVYMRGIVHLSTEVAMKSNIGSVTQPMHQINKLYDQALNSIEPEDLVINGDMDKAKRVWNDMFNSDNGLSEFVTRGLTNPKMVQLLKDLDTDVSIDGVDENASSWKKLTSIFTNIVSKLMSILSPTTGMDGNEQLAYYASQLWEHNNITVESNSFLSTTQRYTEGVRGFADKLIIKGAVAGYNITQKGLKRVAQYDNMLGQISNITSYALEIMNPYQTEKERKTTRIALTEVSKALDGDENRLGLGAALSPEGTLRSLLEYVKTDDPLTTKLERFGIVNTMIDSARQDTIVSVGRTIKDTLKAPNKKHISNEDQVSLTNTLVRLDLQSIMDVYNTKDIQNFVNNSKELAKAIVDETKKLHDLVPDEAFRSLISAQTKGLGQFMSTGISDSSQFMTATDIYYTNGNEEIKDYIKMPSGGKSIATKVIKIIDRLASLEGLKHSKQADKNTLSRLIDTHEVGVATILGFHSTIAEQNKQVDSTAFKGEIKDTSAKGWGSTVSFDDIETQARMKKLGYKKVGETGVDGMAMYVTYSRGLASFEKQALAKINFNKTMHNVDGVLKDVHLEEAVKELNRNKKKMTDEEFGVARLKLDKALEKHKEGIAEQKRDLSDKRLSKLIAQASGSTVTKPDGYLFNKGNFNISIPFEVTEIGLREDNKIPALTGQMLAEIAEKKSAAHLNAEVYKTILDEMMKYNRNDPAFRDDWVEIGPDAIWNSKREEEFAKTLYENMPANIRDRVKSRKEGMQVIAVRRDLAHLHFGMRTNGVLEKKFKRRGENGELYYTSIGEILEELPYGQALSNGMALAYDIWKEVVSMQKVDMVIKTPGTLVGNVLSNWVFSTIAGQDPVRTTKNSILYFRSTKEYLDTKKERDLKQASILGKQYTSLKDKEKIEREILKLNRALARNPVHPLMEAGLFSSVVEDINDDDLVAGNSINDLLEEVKGYKYVRDRTPKIIRDGISQLYMTDDTTLFKVMMMGTQYSDFVARVNRYYALMESDKNLTQDQVIKTITDEFINYNRLISPFINYLNKMGLLWFSNYFFGARKAMIAKAKTTPSLLLSLSATSLPTPMDTILNNNIMDKTNDLFSVATTGVMNNIVPMSGLEMFDSGKW